MHLHRVKIVWTLARLATATCLPLLAAVATLWHRCGLHGCPDINRLDAYFSVHASVILDRSGQELARLSRAERVKVRLDSLPAYLPAAFVAVEDQRFWRHHGVDWHRVAGATYHDLREHSVAEGSSTITMQLARNVFPDRLPAARRTLSRKFAEARVAQLIED
ncbi:MAG TPA: biosynthetic peptidoglycan transglycosylase, partial [Gemmatimonadaceae bacterium]|nr:biosynthetic peptidoglycan transglycosylase [Gemmatimonadaceae bacterium]